jgi:hypothetical protein
MSKQKHRSPLQGLPLGYRSCTSPPWDVIALSWRVREHVNAVVVGIGTVPVSLEQRHEDAGAAQRLMVGQFLPLLAQGAKPPRRDTCVGPGLCRCHRAPPELYRQ